MTAVPMAMMMLFASASIHCGLPKKSLYQRSDQSVIGNRIIAASLNDITSVTRIGTRM